MLARYSSLINPLSDNVTINLTLSVKQYKNPLTRGFSTELSTAFKHLDQIYEDTAPTRLKILKGLPNVVQSFDNYNALHKPSIARDNVATIAHIGMVSNVVRCIEYNKPAGSILRDPHGQQWSVVSSSMPNSWQCVVSLKLRSPIRSCSGVTVKVALPNADWQIVSLHGQPENPKITYVDQPVAAANVLLRSVRFGATTH